jgi:hypothetical protein
MHILRIEHPVPDYDAWKQAFDSDPLNRRESGVRRHRVLRAADDPDHVLIDLEFDTSEQAEAMQAALRGVWSRVDVMRDPQARIVEVVESRDY